MWSSLDDLPDALGPDALGPDAALRSLLLALMSRLLATRGFVTLDGEDGHRVAVVRGRLAVAVGDAVDLGAEAGAPGGLPDGLRVLGAALAVPLRHGTTLGWVALGPRATGEPYTPRDLALARSLASATAASVRASQGAARLAEANRALAGRAQELRTLFELAQAFGRALDREAILKRLAFALMGQLLVSRFAVALRQPDGRLAVAHAQGLGPLDVPVALADCDAPCPIDAASPLRAHGLAWAVPLRAGDVSRGVILLGHRATGEPLDAPGADFAASLAALAVGALETADRVAERVERERIDEELRLARRIQRGLLPAETPAATGLDVAVRWRPSRTVSGDTYDVAALSDGRLLVAVADVVGKGLGAALLMATLQAGFHLLRPDLDGPDPDLGAATARLDRLVAESTEAHQFVTLAWAVVDVRAGRLRYVVAGHPPPRLLRADGRVESLSAGGPLLGVIVGATFEAGDVPFGPGDTLVLYTDGATEAQDAAGDEFGTARLDAALTAARGSAANLLGRLAEAVDGFAAHSGEEPDDLTLVAVRAG